MAQRQTKLSDFTGTEVIEETEQESEDEAEEVFSPRRRRQLEAAGVDLDAARRVEEKLEGEGRWWPEQRSEAEQRYLEVRNKAYLYLPASDMVGVRATRGGYDG